MSEQYNLDFNQTGPKDPELEMIDSLLNQTLESLHSEADRLKEQIRFHNISSDTDSANELQSYLDTVYKAIQIKSTDL